MYISKEDFMTADLTGICRINAIDYSDYIAEKSHDGGHYAFYTTFVKEEYDDKSWYIMYSSSSDFACCPVCGQFADHNDPNEDTCYDSGYTCGEFEVVSTDEMKERIEQMNDIEIQIFRRRIKLSGNENMGVMFESDAPDAVIDEAVENSRKTVVKSSERTREAPIKASDGTVYESSNKAIREEKMIRTISAAIIVLMVFFTILYSRRSKKG